MPSFSRKRRRGAQKKGGTTDHFAYVAKTFFSPLVWDSVSTYAQSGIDVTKVKDIPADNTTSTGQYLANECQVERVRYGNIMTYTPNFSNMKLQIPAALFNKFRRVRFGTLYHTIRRVDSGANWGIWDTQYNVAREVAAPVPTNMGTRPIQLYVNYRYLKMGESLTAQQHHNWYRGRMKRVELKPGRKLVFKHHLLMHSKEYMSFLLRAYVGGATSFASNAEQIALREFSFPTKVRKVRWLPTYSMDHRLAGGDSHHQPFCSSTGTQGNTPGTTVAQKEDLILMGNTMQMFFDTFGFGTHGISDESGLALGSWIQVNRPLIRRSETCRIDLRGFMGCYGTDSVTQLVRQHEYPLIAGASTRITQFAPPYVHNTNMPPRNMDSSWVPDPGEPVPVNVEMEPRSSAIVPEALPTGAQI